jgi:stress-induced morphogen
MPHEKLKERVREALQSSFSSKRDRIEFRDGAAGLHLYVVSPRFRGKSFSETEEMIWPILLKSLRKSEWIQLSLTAGLAPEEANGSFPLT